MTRDEAVRRVLPKEKQIRAVPRKGTGDTKEYLEEQVSQGLDATRVGLEELVGAGKLDQNEVDEVFEALSGIITYQEAGPAIVAVYPEFTVGELYIHAVAIPKHE